MNVIPCCGSVFFGNSESLYLFDHLSRKPAKTVFSSDKKVAKSNDIYFIGHRIVKPALLLGCIEFNCVRSKLSDMWAKLTGKSLNRDLHNLCSVTTTKVKSNNVQYVCIRCQMSKDAMIQTKLHCTHSIDATAVSHCIQKMLIRVVLPTVKGTQALVLLWTESKRYWCHKDLLTWILDNPPISKVTLFGL